MASQPDLLIFHNNNVETLKCLYVQTGIDDDDDDDDASLGDGASSLDDVKLTGFAGEFKVDEAKGDVENKCYYNMFGQGVNLALMVVEKGQIISCVNMYGIVVATHKPDEATLLQVIMSFEKGKCTFRRVYKRYKFVWLMNMMIEHIYIIVNWFIVNWLSSNIVPPYACIAT